VRIIAFDLDGTIVERGEIIIPELVTSLVEAASLGVMVGTASGRPLEDQLRILSINSLGSSRGFPHFLTTNEYEVHLLKGVRYVELVTHNDMIRRAWLEVLPVAKEIIAKELMRLTDAGIQVKRNISDEKIVSRCMIDLWFQDAQEAMEEEFMNSSVLDGSIPLACNRNHRLVQLLHVKAGKGNALRAVADHFKLEPSDVLAIGDSSNDLSMLDCSLGYRSATVANADEAVKQAVISCGGLVASKPRGAGVEEIIDALILRMKKRP